MLAFLFLPLSIVSFLLSNDFDLDFDRDFDDLESLVADRDFLDFSPPPPPPLFDRDLRFLERDIDDDSNLDFGDFDFDLRFLERSIDLDFERRDFDFERERRPFDFERVRRERDLERDFRDFDIGECERRDFNVVGDLDLDFFARVVGDFERDLRCCDNFS